jgi:hypothetical protein
VVHEALAELLPGDIVARFFVMVGDFAMFVVGWLELKCARDAPNFGQLCRQDGVGTYRTNPSQDHRLWRFDSRAEHSIDGQFLTFIHQLSLAGTDS